MGLLLSVATTASEAAIAGGISKFFGISTPKAAAMHAIGCSVAATILQNAPWAPQGDVYSVATICASHLAGKALAKHVCNVDVTAKDFLKILGGKIVVAVLITFTVKSFVIWQSKIER